jgi:hypothetical protein
MALFKCLQTGNTVEFDNEWDIVQMKAHPDYEEVIEVTVVEEPVIIKKAVSKSKAE